MLHPKVVKFDNLGEDKYELCNQYNLYKGGKLKLKLKIKVGRRWKLKSARLYVYMPTCDCCGPEYVLTYGNVTRHV